MSATEERVARMKKMAREPAEALKRWGQLSQGEKSFVESWMGRYYGGEFSKNFHDRTLHDPKADTSTIITNDSSITPERLKAAGYAPKGGFANTKVWVLPSGKELWLLPAAKASPPPIPQAPGGAMPGAPPPTNPDIQDARTWADTLTDRHDQLYQELGKLISLKNQDGSYPQGPFNAYFQKLEKYNQDLKSVLNEEAPLWGGSMSEDETAALNKELDRLKQLSEDSDDLEDLDKP